MPPSVASVGTTAWRLGSSANFTVDFDKPTGLAVGDLMIGCFYADGGTLPITSLTRSGWTPYGPGQASSETSRLFMLTREADSADVAASTFTFTTNYSGSGGGKVGGAILRVTNFGSGTIPVVVTDEDPDRNGTGASFTSFSGAFTPAANNCLLVMLIAGANNETGAGTFSGYTVSGTNPSWTERLDIFDADADDAIFAVATATETTATTRTTASATCSVSQDDYLLLLAAFQPRVDATGTTALVTSSPTLFNTSPRVDTNATNTPRNVSPTIFNPQARGTVNPWTDRLKTTTTWTERTK